MPVQPQLFPEQEPQAAPPPLSAPPQVQAVAGAPVWLQRMSLFVLVLFCVYLGVLVMVLPWWPRMWDQNMFIDAHPQLAHLLHNGAVRGLISGLGALDIWMVSLKQFITERYAGEPCHDLNPSTWTPPHWHTRTATSSTRLTVACSA